MLSLKLSSVLKKPVRGCVPDFSGENDGTGFSTGTARNCRKLWVDNGFSAGIIASEQIRYAEVARY